MQTSHYSMRQFFAFFRVKRGHFKCIVIVGDEFSIFQKSLFDGLK